jgi:hypothetical protein
LAELIKEALPAFGIASPWLASLAALAALWLAFGRGEGD